MKIRLPAMRALAGLDKRFVMALCRVYARHFVKDQPADAIYRFLCRLYFFRVHRYWPHFLQPRSFSEKVWHRMLFERNPLWTTLSDKLKSREFVEGRGKQNYLVPLLWCGAQPQEIPFEQLPARFVVKANHGCGYNVIVQDKAQIDRGEIEARLAHWLAENYGEDQFAGAEWGYRNIAPSLLVEAFIEQAGGVPADYQFHCFSGRTECIQIDIGRYTETHSRTYVDRAFNPLPLEWGKNSSPQKLCPPENYAEMLALAEELAAGFDFIRVDLFSVGERIYVGEQTCYPAGGVNRLQPREFDFILGSKWQIPGR